MSKGMNWDSFYQTRSTRSRPLVIAHRGTPHEAPENTLRSFAQALQQGADVLETDLHMSKDGELVLFHDSTLERMTDGKGYLCDYDLAALKQLRTREPGGRLVDDRIPTLLELLAMTQGEQPLLLELKDQRFTERRFAQKLVETLHVYGALNRSALISFKPELIASIKAVHPAMPAGYVTISDALPRRGTQLMGPFWPLLILNPFYVAWAHALGGIVAPLDPTPEARLRFYLWLGVDAVLADYPGRVVDALEKLTGGHVAGGQMTS
jgi:glycerophosphoryl diester phosphodiesterase